MGARARAELEKALRVERLDRWDEIDIQIDRFFGGVPVDEFARYELRDRIERLITTERERVRRLCERAVWNSEDGGPAAIAAIRALDLGAEKGGSDA